MVKALELAGKTFGRLTAIKKSENQRGKSGVYWDCKCLCGALLSVQAAYLKCGNTSSCGCGHREALAARNYKHGRVGTTEYIIWSGMLDRCRNPKNKSWARYGGRGIQVCERWSDFANFFSDMGPRVAGMSLERVRNDEGYYPENCRWATKVEQANNTRTNRFINAFNERKTISEWVRDTRCKVISPQTLGKRIKRGWHPEAAIATPPAAAHAKAMMGIDPKWEE